MSKNTEVQQMSQDSKQKMNVLISFCLEFYRVLMGCMLIIFVPQNCDGKICGLGENLFHGNYLNDVAFYINIATSGMFCIFYSYEIKRENTLIDYLEVNDDVPNDNEEVGKMLLKLSGKNKEYVLSLDKKYQLFGYLCLICFILNSTFSGIPIFMNYLDSKTITVYVTNVLLLTFKIVDSFSIVNTEENVFYSAYLKNKLQFNDVDPDKCFIMEHTGLSLKYPDTVDSIELDDNSV